MELIEREALLSAAIDVEVNGVTISAVPAGIIRYAPTVDATPVVYGELVNRWDGEYNDFGDCSVCGAENLGDSKVCCQCGARIGGEGHESN